MDSHLSPEAKRYNRAFRLKTALVAAAFVYSANVTTYAYSSTLHNVTIVDGGKSVTVTTSENDPSKILKAAGIMVSANDEINTDDFNSEDGGTIAVERAKTVKVIDNSSIIYCVGYDTLGNTLKNSGFSSEDILTSDASLDDSVYNGMQVVLNKAFPVTVVADGEEQQVYTMGSTVGELIDDAGIEVGEEDEVSHSLDTEIEDNTVITVDRVEYSERTAEEEIPYDTEKTVDPDLFEGDTEVVKEGKAGKKEVVYKDKTVNGELESSEVVSETVISEPTAEVVKIGSKKRPALINFRNGVEPISDLTVPSYVTLGSDGMPTKYVDYLEGVATAYSSGTITSTGTAPVQGTVAVDPNEIPYGSELYIASKDGQYIYGYAIAADTGGFIYTTDNIADLYMESEDMAIEWGRRDVAIYVISYGK